MPTASVLLPQEIDLDKSIALNSVYKCRVIATLSAKLCAP